MAFELPKLPYSTDALHPYISQNTIEFHYGKHHQTYLSNLNNLVTGTPFENASLETIVREAEGAIFNNGAQVWNHSFYFLGFSPSGKSEPSGKLAEAITARYGSFDNFKAEFTKAAVTLFGSGWAWLVKKQDESLDILQESNAGNPLRKGFMPLLTFDVWEHAYYLDYQNRRADHIKALWSIVDWDVISKRFT